MKHKILVLILTICLFASIALSFLPVQQICGVKSGCETVQNSGYENMVGVNNGYIGIIAFFLLLVLTISHIKYPRKYKSTFIFLGITLGTLVALYFIYLQVFVIKAICTYCMIIDLGMVISLLLIFPRRRKAV